MAMAVYKKSLCLENTWSLRCMNKALEPFTVQRKASSEAETTTHPSSFLLFHGLFLSGFAWKRWIQTPGFERRKIPVIFFTNKPKQRTKNTFSGVRTLFRSGYCFCLASRRSALGQSPPLQCKGKISLQTLSVKLWRDETQRKRALKLTGQSKIYP